MVEQWNASHARVFEAGTSQRLEHGIKLLYVVNTPLSLALQLEQLIRESDSVAVNDIATSLQEFCTLQNSYAELEALKVCGPIPPARLSLLGCTQ